MEQSAWEIASSLADIVMAITGVAAAWYGLTQYRNSLRVSEIEFLVNYHHDLIEFRRYVSENESPENLQALMYEAFDKMNFYLTLKADGLITERVAKYVDKGVDLEGSIQEIRPEIVEAMKVVMAQSSKEFPILVSLMEKTDLKEVLPQS